MGRRACFRHHHQDGGFQVSGVRASTFLFLCFHTCLYDLGGCNGIFPWLVRRVSLTACTCGYIVSGCCHTSFVFRPSLLSPIQSRLHVKGKR